MGQESQIARGVISFTTLLPAASFAAGSETMPSAWGALFLPTLILALAGFGAWWLIRRRGLTFVRNGPVKILQTLPLGPRDRLLLVQVDEELLLLGATSASINLLHRLPKASIASSDLTDSANNSN